MAANDPEAFTCMAKNYFKGNNGLPRDDKKAAGLFFRAAELGSAEACFAIAYRKGGYLGHNIAKERHYLKLAAKRGFVNAHYKLGRDLYNNKVNYELGVKHMMITAAAGDDYSLKCIEINILPRQARDQEAIRNSSPCSPKGEGRDVE